MYIFYTLIGCSLGKKCLHIFENFSFNDIKEILCVLVGKYFLKESTAKMLICEVIIWVLVSTQPQFNENKYKQMY